MKDRVQRLGAWQQVRVKLLPLSLSSLFLSVSSLFLSLSSLFLSACLEPLLPPLLVLPTVSGGEGGPVGVERIFEDGGRQRPVDHRRHRRLTRREERVEGGGGGGEGAEPEPGRLGAARRRRRRGGRQGGGQGHRAVRRHGAGSGLFLQS